MDSIKLMRNKLQDRIDGAIGTSNLDVIRGVLYDAKHFDGELGYERPLEHLRDYAKDLGMSSSESESDDEEGSSMLLISGSSDSDDGAAPDGDDGAGADEERAMSPLAAFNSDGAASPQPAEVGPKGLDNVSKAYDREVANFASVLTYVQGSTREQADADKTLRKSLLIVLRSEYEFEQLKLRGLRPVAMGSVSVHGTEDRTRQTWVMAIRGIKFYCGVETKPELQAILEKIEVQYRNEMNRRSEVKHRRKEIEAEKQYPRFQRAMVNLLQLPEFPDEQDFRMGLRKSVEATLTDIYSQPHPNPERFTALLTDASETVAEALKTVHSTFVESKQRHAATKSDAFEAAVEELLRQLPTTDSMEEDEEYQEQITKQLRLAVIDSNPKRFDKLLANVAPVVKAALEKCRDAFTTVLKNLEAEAQRKKMNAGWLTSLWGGIAPDKEVDDASSRELRRIRKALARGRRGGMVDQQAIAEQEAEARRLAELAAAGPESDSEDEVIRRRAPPREQEKMVTLEEAYEMVSAKLQINDDIVKLTTTEIILKAREKLALPVIEISESNLESETRMVCLGLGILIEDDDYKERKKAQSYKSGRGRRQAMQAIGMIQQGTKWQAGGMSAKDGKVWWCSSCNYKNAPRWRCSMCGHRNSEMATEATPAIYSNRMHVEPSAERRALSSMQEVFMTAKNRADVARKVAEKEEAAARAEAEVAETEERIREQEADEAAERETAAQREWLTKAAERSALAVAEADRRNALATRVRRVMEEDLEANRERRRAQLQRLEKKMMMRDDSIGPNATAPQLGMMNAASETGTLIPLNQTAGTFLPGETSGKMGESHAATGTAEEWLSTAQLKDEAAGLSALAGGYAAEQAKALVVHVANASGEVEHALADIHDPLGLQIAAVHKLQQRPGSREEQWQGAVKQRRAATPEDVRMMRNTLTLAGMVRLNYLDDDGQLEIGWAAQRDGLGARSGAPGQSRTQREQGFDSSPTRAAAAKQRKQKFAAKPLVPLLSYQEMTKQNKKVLQKRTRRYGHLVTDYDRQDRATLMHMTV